MSPVRFLGLMLLFLGAACSSPPPSPSGSPPRPQPASLSLVRMQSVDHFHEATGTIRSRTTTRLSSQLLGRVTAVYIREGEEVSAGQVLVKLEDREVRAQQREAQAGLREAESALEELLSRIREAQAARSAAAAERDLADVTYRRFLSLFERGSVSAQEFDEVRVRHEVSQARLRLQEEALESLEASRRQAEARIEQARAALQQSEVQLGYARIAAPFAGRVTRRQVEPGTLALPGQPLMEIEEQVYRLEALVPESELAAVRRGQEVVVFVDSLASSLSGRVSEIVPVADPATRTFAVKVSLPSQPGLYSGIYARALFPSGRRPALTVPTSSLLVRGQLQGVYVVAGDGKARFRLVQPGQSFGQSLEILSGLQEGEQVVVEPEGIREGTPVLPSGPGPQPAPEGGGSET